MTAQLTPNLQNLISAALLRLRMKAPFFATLALFTTFRPTVQVACAATDGKDIFFNPDYLRSLPPVQQDGLLLHEVLHAALMHVLRRGIRDAELWNIAADLVVNGMIAEQNGFELPPGGLRDPSLERLSVEEIYELLQSDPSQPRGLPMPDLMDGMKLTESRSLDKNQQKNIQKSLNEDKKSSHEASSSTNQIKQAHPKSVTHSNNQTQHQSALDEVNEIEQPTIEACTTQVIAQDSLSQHQKAALENHWRNALHQAAVIARTTSQGVLPAGIDRELELLTTPQLDWRSHLWRYLVQTPTDFAGFDRRFVGQGIYLDTLMGESVQVYVAVDTSGSISPEQLRLFLSEVQGILHAYPHLHCELYYADAEVYGPFSLDANRPLPQPQGGGGTSFVPFFQQVCDRWDGLGQPVCVYLTDGYGTFPRQPPPLPVLWVVVPGGLALPQFPFGEAVRLLPHSG